MSMSTVAVVHLDLVSFKIKIIHCSNVQNQDAEEGKDEIQKIRYLKEHKVDQIKKKEKVDLIYSVFEVKEVIFQIDYKEQKVGDTQNETRNLQI